MAQIMVDTDSEPIAGLMLLSRLLTDYANMRAVQDKALADSYAKADPLQEHTHTYVDPRDGATVKVVGQPRETGALPELGAGYTTQPVDPAKMFGKFALPKEVPTGTNVVPLFPSPGLNLPGATGPAVLDVPNAGAVPVAPGNVTAASTIPVAPIAPTPVAPNANALSADVDSAGLSWDERIHSSSKAKKGDGTWKIKRGLDAGVAQMVTAAALAAKIVTPTMNVPALSTAVPQNVPIMSPVPALVSNTPVTLPPTSTSAVPVFPGASVLPGATAVPTAPASAVPVSDVSAAGAVPAAPVSPVVRFREMMGKISAALGSKAITQENVKAAHEAVGLAQLQQAVLHPDKIPQIEAALGLS